MDGMGKPAKQINHPLKHPPRTDSLEVFGIGLEAFLGPSWPLKAGKVCYMSQFLRECWITNQEFLPSYPVIWKILELFSYFSSPTSREINHPSTLDIQGHLLKWGIWTFNEIIPKTPETPQEVSAWMSRVSKDDNFTVDGSEIRRAPVDMVVLSHYLQGFILVRWCRNSEPSREAGPKMEHLFFYFEGCPHYGKLERYHGSLILFGERKRYETHIFVGTHIFILPAAWLIWFILGWKVLSWQVEFEP